MFLSKSPIQVEKYYNKIQKLLNKESHVLSYLDFMWHLLLIILQNRDWTVIEILTKNMSMSNFLQVKNNMCEAEQVFFSKYSRDLAQYMRSAGDGAGVDLMSDLKPPKSLFLEVRCREDYGEMETEDGELVVLKKNTQHFLPRNLCEPLIRQGILEQIHHH